MNNSYIYRFRTYRKRGSQIAELPPALMLLFFIFFFPMLNLFYLCLAYGAGWYLNNIETREVACHVPIETPPPTGKFVALNYTLNEKEKWGNFMGVSEAPDSPQVAQFPLGKTGPSANLVGTSTVMTTVTIKPFMIMPFFANIPWLSTIPGLGKPIDVTYFNTIQQEEQGLR